MQSIKARHSDESGLIASSTLDAIAREGAEAFYEGPIGTRLSVHHESVSFLPSSCSISPPPNIVAIANYISLTAN